MKKKTILLALFPLLLCACETSSAPSSEPTSEPTSQDTSEPTSVPTSEPTSEPTSVPTSEPTSEPTSQSTYDPDAQKVWGVDNPSSWGYKGKITASNLYFEFFDHASDIQFDVAADDMVWTLMEKYQTSGSISNPVCKYYDLYFPCSLNIKVNGRMYSYDDVGIRLRGNTSRNSFYNTTTNRFTGPCNFKLSFKATFDDAYYDDIYQMRQYKVDWTGRSAERAERKDRNFAGMEKLDLKFIPRCFMTEYQCNAQNIYCMDSFNNNGLMAAKTNVAKVQLWAGISTYSSAYEVLEPIDKPFLKKRFSKADAKGDLYKCTWAWTGQATLNRTDAVTKDTDALGRAVGTRIARGKIGVEDNYNAYKPTYDLKTNDDGENSDFSKMANFINVIYNCANQKGGKDELEEVLNVNYWLAFSAMSEILGNPDDMRYNGNNFYVYFLPSDHKAYFIPYDFDWSIGCTWTGVDNRIDAGIWTVNGIYGAQYAVILHATFYADGNVGYSKAEYRQKYSDYCYRYVTTAGVLDYTNYCDVADPMKYCAKTERTQVISYMSRRTAAVKRSCI